MAIALKGSGITEPRDLVGKTFGAPGDESEFIIRSMLASRGIDYGSGVAVVPMGFDMSPLPDEDLDAMAAY